MEHDIPENIRKVLQETREVFCTLYGQRIKEIILFGSYARGDYSSGSDIDLLLLLDQLDDMDIERSRYMPAVCDLSLKYDTVLSVVPMEYETYKTRKTPLILNVQREGVCL